MVDLADAPPPEPDPGTHPLTQPQRTSLAVPMDAAPSSSYRQGVAEGPQAMASCCSSVHRPGVSRPRAAPPLLTAARPVLILRSRDAVGSRRGEARLRLRPRLHEPAPRVSISSTSKTAPPPAPMSAEVLDLTWPPLPPIAPLAASSSHGRGHQGKSPLTVLTADVRPPPSSSSAIWM
jgi:hypothetical protein